MHFSKIAVSLVAGAITHLATAAPTEAFSADAAPPPPDTFTTFRQEYQHDILEGWHKAKDLVLQPSAGGASFVGRLQNVSAIEEKAKLYFSTFHGGEKPLLSGFPAEVDLYVLKVLAGGWRCRANETACEISAARAFEHFEKRDLLEDIRLHEHREGRTAAHADLKGFQPRFVSRDDMLEMLQDNTAFDDIDDDQIMAMRNFLAEPVYGFARKTFGSVCDGHPEKPGPKPCEESSLLQLAERWAELYPHEEKKADPREDWLTLFDIFTWWNETMYVTEDTVTKVPFREIVQGWEKTYSRPLFPMEPIPWWRPSPWWRRHHDDPFFVRPIST